MWDNTQHVPKVEVLRHVDLLENIHEALFLCRFFDFVAKAHRNNVGVLAMIKIVSSQKGNDRAFGYQDHIPSSRESNET